MIADLGVKYQVVRDYTSMVVLTEEPFSEYGLDRRNRARLAVESAASVSAFETAPGSRRVDNRQPMFHHPAPTHSSQGNGSGAVDPIGLLLIVLLATTAMAVRRRSWRHSSSS